MHVEIPLHGSTAAGRVALVDERDELRVNWLRWNVSAGGYPAAGLPRSLRPPGSCYMHSLILGRTPKGLVTDHINGNKLDNRRANLRRVPQSLNACNRHESGGASGFIGVRFRRRPVVPTSKRVWEARISLSNKQKSIGFFLSSEEAAVARDMAVIKFRDEYAVLNFPHLRIVNGGTK